MTRKVVNFPQEWVAGFTRNQWQVCSGMGGRFRQESTFTRLTQILPLNKDSIQGIEYCDNNREIEWPILNKIEILSGTLKCEIEPGERDEMCFEFLLEENIEQIMIYSYIENIRKKARLFGLIKKGREMGWKITTIYNFKEK